MSSKSCKDERHQLCFQNAWFSEPWAEAVIRGDFQDGAKREGGGSLWGSPASDEEAEAGRGREEGDWRGGGGAEGGRKGSQKEASPRHRVYRLIMNKVYLGSISFPDSCDCEEFGLPLAKRIHGLNLLQTKKVSTIPPISWPFGVYFCYSGRL